MVVGKRGCCDEAVPQRKTETLRGCTNLRVILRNLEDEKKRQNQRH